MNIHRIRLSLVGVSIARTSIFIAIVILSQFISPTTILSGTVSSQIGASFDLFRIVEKQSSDQSQRLQSIKITERGSSYFLFTEPSPSFKIPLSEIISITIERERIRGWKVKNRERETERASSQSKNQQNTVAMEDGYVYKATFSISKSEKKRFDGFAIANERQSFDFRFGDKRLGTVQFVGRFDGGSTFTSYLEATNVKDVFGSLKEKVIWK